MVGIQALPREPSMLPAQGPTHGKPPRNPQKALPSSHSQVL